MTPTFINKTEATIPKEADNAAEKLFGSYHAEDTLQNKNLTSALYALSKHVGFSLIMPEEIETDIHSTLHTIAAKSGVRFQEITLLQQDWWLKDHGPLLVFDTHKQQYITLLPLSSGGYRAHDDLTYQINAKNAHHIDKVGYHFFLTFPEGETTLWQIFKSSIQPSKKEILSILGSQVLLGIIGLLTPIFLGIVVDYAIVYSDRGMLGQIVFGLLAALVCGLILNMLQAVAILRLKLMTSIFVQSALWDRLVRLPLSFYRLFGVGELMERIYGLDMIYQQINHSFMKIFLSIFWGFFSIFLIFYYNARIGFTVLAGSLILSIFSLASIYIQTIYFQKLAYFDGRSSNLLLQILNALKKIRVAHKEEIFFKKWLDPFASRLHFFFKARTTSIITGFFQGYFNILLMMMVYIVFIMQKENASLGNFILINGLIGNFITSFSAFNSTIANYLYLVPLYARIKPILTTSPEPILESQEEVKNFKEIFFDNVSFSYNKESKKQILSDVTLKIPQGHFIAVVGSSGSGKTTLVRLLLGLEAPQTGKILIDNMDLTYLPKTPWRQQCGIVLQSTDLMPGTVLENITYFDHNVSAERINNALKLANLTLDIERLPMGLQTLVMEQGYGFSLGQRQRILIARALYRDPKMLILDEATSALDNMSQKIIYDNFQQLGLTRVVIAHRLSTIQQADYIYVLSEGKIAEEGTFDELMSHSGLFHQLVNKQT